MSGMFSYYMREKTKEEGKVSKRFIENGAEIIPDIPVIPDPRGT
jgi:hypothetical protein